MKPVCFDNSAGFPSKEMAVAEPLYRNSRAVNRPRAPDGDQGLKGAAGFIDELYVFRVPLIWRLQGGQR